jgi:hypothetical protein
MPWHMMDLTPLLYVSRSMERPLFLLFGRLLLSIPTIYCIDLPIFLLFLLQRPLVMWIKEPGSGL